ncbi:MAG: hypothetical protein ACFFB5_02295 [Promethearchaeota archaeon]
MTQNSNPQDEIDLQLAQGIIDLTKVVEQNKAMIEKITTDLEQASSKIEEWEKKLQDWDLNLGTRFDETENQFSRLEGKFEQQISNIEQNLEEVSTQFGNLEEKLEQQTSAIEQKFEEVSTQFGNLEEKLEQQTSAIEQKFEEISTQFTEIEKIQSNQKNLILSQQQALKEQDTEIQHRIQKEEFNTTIEGINERISNLNQDQETTQSELKDHAEKTQERFDTLAKTIELVGDGLEQLEKHKENHATLLEELRVSLSQFKHKLKELISLAKEDQKALFDNFSRIVESYNENIRTELTIMAQSLKESDTQILDEVSASFTPKKIGKELQQTIADLANELRTEAQKTRDDLVEGLQKNVQEYETIMEEQNTSIKNYQQQLEGFQDEILAIIDRKVNEKYEVVFSLLSKVAVQAEEIALLIKTSEIQIPSSTFQKNQTSSKNVDNISKKPVETNTVENFTNEDK